MPLMQPEINVHGSFSMMVNYHALGVYAHRLDGRVLNPPQRHTNLNVSAYYFGAGDHIETRQAYREAIALFGPDDFFALKKGMEKACEMLTLPQIITYLKWSEWDTDIFLGCFPVLLSRAASSSETMRGELRQALHNVWEMHVPMGEHRDLPFHLGMLCYGIACYPEALEFFQQSTARHGSHVSTDYNMSLCYYQLGEWDQALGFANKALEADPSLDAAIELRMKIHDLSGIPES